MHARSETDMSTVWWADVARNQHIAFTEPRSTRASFYIDQNRYTYMKPVRASVGSRDPEQTMTYPVTR